jgi:hypothetical protein
MGIYDYESQQRLINKLDYEIWVLDFLGNAQDVFYGKTDISSIKITNGQNDAHTSIVVKDSIGAAYKQRIVDALTPLTFTASYKILDMVYEWILEENKTIRLISDVPWSFSQKLNLIKNTRLQYPPLFANNSYIKDYSFAFLNNLLPYRNEVIHSHRFSVTGDKIVLTDNKTSAKLELDKKQMGYLVRLVVALAQCLTGKISFNVYLDRLIKYHFNELAIIHHLQIFKQKLPLLVNIELKVPKEANGYKANLKFVRELVSRMHQRHDVLFNLTLMTQDKDCITGKWHFSVNDVPNIDVLDIEKEQYNGFKQN